MKNTIMIILFCIAGFSGKCQDSTVQKKTALEQEKYWQNWLKDMYEVGIEQHGDSVKISNEVKKIITDKEYQKDLYPISYTIPAAGLLMKNMEIKKAMWYFINIYGQSKENSEVVMKIILPFEQGLELDKVLVSTFYTYALVDPQIGSLKNGKVQITRPDLLEQKFNRLKEMIAYIIEQRKTQNQNARKAVGTDRSEALQQLGKGNIKSHVKIK